MAIAQPSQTRLLSDKRLRPEAQEHVNVYKSLGWLKQLEGSRHTARPKAHSAGCCMPLPSLKTELLDGGFARVETGGDLPQGRKHGDPAIDAVA